MVEKNLRRALDIPNDECGRGERKEEEKKKKQTARELESFRGKFAP